MHAFELDPTIRLGTVFEVSGTSIKIALNREIDELTRLHRGQLYAVGTIGSMIKIHVGRQLLFAVIHTLRLQTEEEASALQVLQSESRVMEAEVIGEGSWDAKNQKLHFSRGLSSSALPMQDVYLLTIEETECVYGSGVQIDEQVECFVPIGHYVGTNFVECRANIDKMFGHHCAVLGSTGTGKSSAVAAILKSVLEHKVADREVRPNIILIDPHGEYRQALGDRCVVYRAYNPLGQTLDEGRELRLPYWLMTSEEFRSLVVGKTEFEATSQSNTVYKALAHARMVQAGLIEPAQKDVNNTPEGKHPQDAILRPNVHECQIASFDRDKPIPFSLLEFRRHIEWR